MMKIMKKKMMMMNTYWALPSQTLSYELYSHPLNDPKKFWLLFPAIDEGTKA